MHLVEFAIEIDPKTTVKKREENVGLLHSQGIQPYTNK
jgi:hypothetical protein